MYKELTTKIIKVGGKIYEREDKEIDLEFLRNRILYWEEEKRKCDNHIKRIQEKLDEYNSLLKK